MIKSKIMIINRERMFIILNFRAYNILVGNNKTIFIFFNNWVPIDF